MTHGAHGLPIPGWLALVLLGVVFGLLVFPGAPAFFLPAGRWTGLQSLRAGLGVSQEQSLCSPTVPGATQWGLPL